MTYPNDLTRQIAAGRRQEALVQLAPAIPGANARGSCTASDTAVSTLAAPLDGVLDNLISLRSEPHLRRLAEATLAQATSLNDAVAAQHGA